MQLTPSRARISTWTAPRLRASAIAVALLASSGCATTAPEDERASRVTSGLSGTFTTLSYNVAGLLEPFSSSHPSVNTPIISCLIKDYDIVEVQEDFNYHAALYDTCDDHPYRSPTTGGMGIGSGLNILSRFPYIDLDRVTWRQRTASDALTPKGFTLSRVRIAEGVYLDVYNLHAQSETTEAALAASRSDMDQLLGYIETNSAGNAVLVMGDTNTRYTRAGQNIGDFFRHGFRDVWIDLVRGGVAPTYGTDALTACGATTSAGCEIVDKILYRNNRLLTLTPVAYRVESDRFVDGNGAPLSDHWPVRVTWQFTTASNWQLSDTWGGPHGDEYNDLGVLPENAVVASVALRTGARVDRIGVTLSNGFTLQHGGSGGNLQTLTMAAGEFLTAADLCSAQNDGHTRVFYAKLYTSLGRTLAGGAQTSDCTTFTAPASWQIVGFHGRSGDEVDRLGVIYAPRRSSVPGAPAYAQYVNRLSNLCLDIASASMANGTNVAQWSCNGGAWQRWYHEPVTGLVHSLQDPGYCLDGSGVVADGSNTVLWRCVGNANQQFDVDAATGVIRSRTNPSLVLDGANAGTAPGTDAILWTDGARAHQRWNLVN